MLYHVIRRPPHNNLNSSNKSQSNYNNGSVPELMPRYHYSRTAPHSATTSSESFFPRNHLGEQSSKPLMTTTSNNQYSYGPFKSTFIPLITNSRTMTPNKREFVQIPITREDGTSITNNAIRSVPITFINETNSLPSNSNNGNTSSKSNLTSFLRPSSKYFQHHFNNNSEESAPTTPTNIPRLPSVSRRLSLTIPVMTTTDDDTSKQNIPPSPIRQIPIRFPQQSNVASIPINSSRISSAILRSSPLSSSSNNQLQRQKTDILDTSSSDFSATSLNTSPVRRAEVMAREAIQGIVRFQQQQQHRNGLISDNNNNTSVRTPSLSRRIIVNLKNNQSVSLDSRLSSANASSMKPLQVPSSSRAAIQRNNLYHIPILHEIQMPPHPVTQAAETSLQLPRSSSASNNNSSYKNEFRMEIPITVVTSNDQENRIQQDDDKEDGIADYDQQTLIITERIASANANSNQTLKSILKRSSSRETVSRKNVSFMNA